MKKNKKRGAVFEVFERSEIHRFCSTLPLYIFNYMINISFQYLMTDKRYIIQHYTHCLSSFLFQASYNSSFTSLSLLLSWLSLISEDSAFGSEVGFSVLGADVGFWILKGIEAFFLRNLYNATTVRSTSTLICKHQKPDNFCQLYSYQIQQICKSSIEKHSLHLQDRNSCFQLGRKELLGIHQTGPMEEKTHQCKSSGSNNIGIHSLNTS